MRRDSFVEVAQRLIQTKGYEQLSVQDVLDATGASKGAFYHYFNSKEALLEAVIERIGDAVIVLIAPIATDRTLTPLEKLQRIFITAGQWKAERKDLMLALARAWYSDHNAIVRERLRNVVSARLAPLIATILREGKELRVFDVGSPDHAAAILVGLLLDTGDATKDMLFARQEGAIPFAEVELAIASYNQAFERILGLAPGSFQIIDPPTLHFWFD